LFIGVDFKGAPIGIRSALPLISVAIATRREYAMHAPRRMGDFFPERALFSGIFLDIRTESRLFSHRF
jgi:hypothetical protein